MIIPYRFGHNELCQGAIGILNEVVHVRRYGARVIQLLEEVGNKCIDCTPPPMGDSNTELAYGVNKANAVGGDLFLSFHLNCFNKLAKGAEIVVYDANPTLVTMGNRMLGNLAGLGITNRGVKTRGGDLYELRATKMKAMIIEPFFLDNQGDVNIYNANFEKFCRAIANGIDPRVSLTPPAPTAPKLEDRVCIDNPKNGTTTDSTFELNGWALGRGEIELILNGASCGKMKTNVPRTDVQKAYPQYKTLNSGFKWGINIESLKMGENTMVVWSGNASQTIKITRVPKVCPTCHRPL